MHGVVLGLKSVKAVSQALPVFSRNFDWKTWLWGMGGYEEKEIRFVNLNSYEYSIRTLKQQLENHGKSMISSGFYEDLQDLICPLLFRSFAGVYLPISLIIFDPETPHTLARKRSHSEVYQVWSKCERIGDTNKTGVIILPTQKMHFIIYKGNPSNLPYICMKFDFPKICNLMTPVKPYSWRTPGLIGSNKNRLKSKGYYVGIFTEQ